jgi:hypothetical protein
MRAVPLSREPRAQSAFRVDETRMGGRGAGHPPHRADVHFWHYLRSRWQRNAGLRIDHLLLSPAAADRLQAADVDRAIRGEPGASDHAPVGSNFLRRRRDMKSSLKPSQGRSRPGSARPPTSKPLLVIDGDSFAHRAYHALPKTIRRKDGKRAGAIVGELSPNLGDGRGQAAA